MKNVEKRHESGQQDRVREIKRDCTRHWNSETVRPRIKQTISTTWKTACVHLSRWNEMVLNGRLGSCSIASKWLGSARLAYSYFLSIQNPFKMHCANVHILSHWYVADAHPFSRNVRFAIELKQCNQHEVEGTHDEETEVQKLSLCVFGFKPEKWQCI